MSVEQQSPAAPVSTPVDGVEVLGALSPSRAGDFLSCPLLYRFRTIDHLPEPPSPDAVRGTVVHKVLEDLFDLPAEQRTPDRARALLEPAFDLLAEQEPALREMFAEDGPEAATWLASCRSVLERYFTLEDPRRLEPAEREVYVETLLDSKLLLRGFVDRVDVAPDGAIRVVDYKGLAVDTPLPTPSGWTTMAEVQVGDELLGTDGRPIRVLQKSSVHDRPCYRVRFRDGSEVICDNVHLWRVVTSHRQATTHHTLDTDALAAIHDELRRAGTPNSLWVEAAGTLDLPEVHDLPVDPWLLGAWLGDGSTRSGQLTVGAEDLDDMLTLIKERWSRPVRVRPDGTAFTVTPSRSDERCLYGHDDWIACRTHRRTRRCRQESQHAHMSPCNLTFRAELAQAGVLGNKHIPARYLRAGREQRIDLLRGLLDTDGWWNAKRHRAGFTTTDDRLAEGVLELLHTLGIAPCHFRKPYVNPRRPSRMWHVIEFTPAGFNPFALARKALLAQTGVTDLQQALSRRRVIAAVEPVERVPTQCVQVNAPNSLYLCGTGFVPTHNTGRSPSEMFEAKALFQMRFYALVIWRTRGVMPAMLQLLYLGNGEMLRYVPDERDLLATERKVEAIWRAIRAAEETGDWLPNRGRQCDWCAHRAICPAWGGTAPPLPVAEPADDAS
jgi:RecB family exonuclease